ncbi:MAG: hypothetical protein MI673_09060, partial [Thiotrichales bacterium]|nr:hypothetical protein [Thiotrichales bacterium]
PADQGIFMDDNVVTHDFIKAELAADDGFPDPSMKCGIYARSFRGDEFDQQEYEALDSACAGLDPGSFVGF